MDEEEIEAWYEEQKEKLTEKYRADIAKSKNPEKLKVNYTTALKSLQRKYEKRSEKKINSNLKAYFRSYRINRLKEKILKPFREFRENHSKKKKS
jgi:uncharacterized membrane protein YheB (UPF0754 family)